MSNWITDFFKNRGIKKEAELTDQRTEYDRKMQSSSWIKDAMDIDEDEIVSSEIKKFAAEEHVRTVEAAYDMGDDMSDTLKKDHELRVKGLSDINLAEMLTEQLLKFEGLPERWSVEMEKQKKYVSGNREEAEKKLLKLLGTHTLEDWKEAFKKFEEEDGTKEPKGLYEPEFNPGKQNWDKKEDFDAPSDKEKTKAMEEVGTGHEEDKKAIGDEKLLDEQRKEAELKKKADEPVAEPQGEPMGDVWNLESPDQEAAAAGLSQIADSAMQGNEDAKQFLMELWEESWPSIEEKLKTEGSAWYVWWMDGVNMLMQGQDQPEQPVESMSNLEAADREEFMRELTHQKQELSKDPKGKHEQIERFKEKLHPGYKAEPFKEVEAKAPPKWKHTVEKMKKEPGIDNPFALAWWMKDKGMVPHQSAQDGEIVAKVSKADTIKKVAEVDSIWKVIKDESGQDVIARVEPATNTKVSTEEEDDHSINSSELH